MSYICPYQFNEFMHKNCITKLSQKFKYSNTHIYIVRKGGVVVSGGVVV